MTTTQPVLDCLWLEKVTHTQAKNKANTWKNSQPQIPAKEARASFHLLTTHTNTVANTVGERALIPDFQPLFRHRRHKSIKYLLFNQRFRRNTTLLRYHVRSMSTTRTLPCTQRYAHLRALVLCFFQHRSTLSQTKIVNTNCRKSLRAQRQTESPHMTRKEH